MTTWRWGCIECLVGGTADGSDHALALLRSHEAYACPAFATVYDDAPVPRPDKNGKYHMPSSAPGNGYVQRVARHNLLAAAYPDEVPRWDAERHSKTRWANREETR